MRSVKITFFVAIALLAVAIVVVLLHAPLVVSGTNSVPAAAPIGLTRGNTSSCQAGTLPQGTSGIRVSLAAGAGPTLRLKVLSGSRVVTQGERPAGWGVESNVVVPVKALPRTVRNGLICIAVGPTAEPVPVYGVPIRHGLPRPLGLKDVRLRLEYLRPGSRSWLSLASSISHHMGLGRAAGGGWVAFLVIAVMITIAILAARLTLEELQ